MFCEMCGQQTNKVIRIRVEGAVMEACEKCARLGTPVDPPRKEPAQYQVKIPSPVFNPPPKKVPIQKRPAKPVARQPDVEHVEINPDFASIIKSAREKMSWTQDDLASKMMEKKNVLSSMERGVLRPDVKTARKLEKILGVSLLETL